MNKLIYILTVFTLMIVNPGTEIYAQKETSNKNDTLILGGIYRVLLTDGSDITGELTRIVDSTIYLKVNEKIYPIEKNQIKSIEIGIDAHALRIGGIYRILLKDGRDITGEITGERDSTVWIRVNYETLMFKKNEIREIEIAIPITDEDNSGIPNYKPKEKKFKMLGSVQTGLSIPTGDFNTNYNTSSGFQIAAYTLFSTITGIGAEFQYNNFHGVVYYNKATYSYTKVETGSYNSSMLKCNLMIGNLKPENAAVYYFLLGIGLQYNTTGDVKITYVTYNSSEEYTTSSDNGTSFLFGLGAGFFVKTSKKIGINLEIQFNDITNASSYSDDSGGFYSIKAGIMYTNF